MKRMLFLFVSLFVMASIVQAEPKLENPGQPFEQINHRLDETNVKIDTANDTLDIMTTDIDLIKKNNDDLEEVAEETKEIVEETQHLVWESHDAIGGSCYWVSPHWSIRGVEWGEYWKDHTIITIYNPRSQNLFNHVYVIFEDEFGIEIHREKIIGMLPGMSKRFEVQNILPNELGVDSGIIRIESFDEVLVEGEILTVIKRENDYVGSHSRTMTWHPINLETSWDEN